MALRILILMYYSFTFEITRIYICNCQIDSPNFMTSASTSVESITGLNNILSVFENSHFLLILTDFRNTGFDELSYPTIYRKISVVWWKRYSKTKRRFMDVPLYIQEEILKRNKPVPKSYIRNQSLQFHHWAANWHFLPILNISSFWKATRPWNNIVSIALLPNVSLHQIVPSADFRDHITPVIRNLYSFPSPVPPIKILIIHYSELQLRNHLSGLTIRLMELISDGNEYISHGRIYLVTTMPTSLFKGGEVKLIGSITSIHELNTIQFCRRLVSIHVNLLPNYEEWSALSDMAQLTKSVSQDLCQGSPQNHKILLNFLTNITYVMDIINTLKDALQVCHKDLAQDSKSESTESQLVITGYASVWLSVLGNFSYLRIKNKICDDGKLVQFSKQKVELGIYHTFMPTVISIDQSTTPYLTIVSTIFNDLRFITCGYRGLNKLPFTELLKVLDTAVWLLLIITMVTNAIVLQKLSTYELRLTLAHSLLVPMKILLEQGSPFPGSLINNRRCKLLSVAVLLTGIILSNAYKSTNVYNLIIPRKPLLYQYLQELMNDSFTIHTRTRYVAPPFVEPWLSKYASSEKTFTTTRAEPHFRTYELRSDSQHLTSEVMHFSEVEQILVEFRQCGLAKEIITVLDPIYNVSSLVPLTFPLLQNVITNLEIRSNLSKIFGHEKEYLEEFARMEWHKLLQFLRTCKRAAMVLPTHLGFEVVKKLGKEGYDDAYLGVEKYYEVNIGFVMRGLVPLFFVQRVKYAHRCGLWMRWYNLFKQDVTKGERRQESLKKPTMDGNISVIFTLLLSGLLASATWLCVELFFCHALLKWFSGCRKFSKCVFV